MEVKPQQTEESMYSTSQISSSRSYANIDQSLVTDSVFSLIIKMCLTPTIAYFFYYSLQLFYIHLVLYYDGLQTVYQQVTVFPLIELVTRSIPRAAAMSGKKQLQTYLLVSVAIGATAYLTLPNFCREDQISTFFMILVIAGIIGASLQEYTKQTLDVQKLKNEESTVLVVDAGVLMICMNLYYIFTGKSKDLTVINQSSNTILALLIVISQLASYIYYLLLLFQAFKLQSLMAIKLRFKTLKPFRVKFLMKMFGDILYQLLYEVYEPIITTLIVIKFGQLTNQIENYWEILILIFYVYRCLCKIGQCFTQSTFEFLQSFYNSNLQVNTISRVYQMLLKGSILLVAIQIIMSGIIYWVSSFVGSAILLSAMTPSDAEVCKLLLSNLRLSAVSALMASLNPHVRSLLAADNTKQFKKIRIANLILQLLFIMGCVLGLFATDESYNYISMHVASQIATGLDNLISYSLIMIKYSKAMKLMSNNQLVESTSQLEIQEKIQKDSVLQMAQILNNEERAAIINGKLELDQIFSAPSQDFRDESRQSQSNNLFDRKSSILVSNTYNEAELNQDFILKPHKKETSSNESK